MTAINRIRKYIKLNEGRNVKDVWKKVISYGDSPRNN